jgi:hypothetical protein
VRCREDQRLITGKGRFTDDINLAGQAYGHILRSPHAYTRIVSDRHRGGVLAAFTIEDLDADGVSDIPTQVLVPGQGGEKMFVQTRTVLALGVAMSATGSPISSAETLDEARDAAELIEVEYQALPDCRRSSPPADKPGEPLLYPERGSNLCVHWESYDAALDFVNNRVVGSPMEPSVARPFTVAYFLSLWWMGWRRCRPRSRSFGMRGPSSVGCRAAELVELDNRNHMGPRAVLLRGSIISWRGARLATTQFPGMLDQEAINPFPADPPPATCRSSAGPSSGSEIARQRTPGTAARRMAPQRLLRRHVGARTTLSDTACVSQPTEITQLISTKL